MGAKTGDPSCIDHIDIDKVSRFALWASGSPAQLIRDWDEVNNLRKKRAEQMAKMQAQQSDAQQKQTGMEIGAKVAGKVMEEKMTNEMRESTYD